MRTISAAVAATLVVLGAGVASAQRPGVTVQLPTLSQFSVNTTVSVPDAGTGYLGGIGRGGFGGDEFGVPLGPGRPWRNSALGCQGSVSGASVTATIHDFRAMDEALLSQPTPQWGLRLMGPQAAVSSEQQGQVQLFADGKPTVCNPWAGTVPELAGAGRDAPAMSVAEARAQHQREQDGRQAEGSELFDRGLRAQQAGKPGVARVYYQMAARRASGELRQEALAKLASLGKPETHNETTRPSPVTDP